MIRAEQKLPAVAALSLVAVWALLYQSIYGALDVLRNFKVELSALSLFTVNMMHLFNGLLLPGAVAMVAVLLWRRENVSWYGALTLCLLCDLMAIGAALPLMALSSSVGGGPKPAQLPLLMAIPLVVLALNQVVLALLVLKRHEFVDATTRA